MRIIISILFLSLFTSCSCSKNETIWSRNDIFSKIRKYEPNYQLVVPKDISEYVIHCEHYVPHCLSGYKVKIKGIELTFLEYENHEDAKNSAQSFKGYYKNNWAFDDLRDEPILERFVVKAFGAIKVE